MTLTPPSSRRTSSEQDAELYDAVVVPRFSKHFSRLVLNDIPSETRATVLDVGCGTGHPTLDVLGRIGEGGRVIAIDTDAGLLQIARRKTLDDGGRRVFFKTESVEDLSFGDQVFDVVLGNLIVEHLEHPSRAFDQMKRVLVTGGKLLLSSALEGSFQELFDMFYEVAIRLELPEIEERARAISRRYWSATRLAEAVVNAGFSEVSVRSETFELVFRDASEVFNDPLIRGLNLSDWRWIAGFDGRAYDVMRAVEESLDTYFDSGPISVSVHAGAVVARRRD